MTTAISENPADVTDIKVTNIGHYSRNSISQKFYIYNFSNAAWELVDTSKVGNQDDVTVSWIIASNITDYI